MLTMHCDQAGCLTEASTGSITEEEGNQKQWTVGSEQLRHRHESRHAKITIV